MKKIKYIIEATEDSYTESLSYDGTTVSKTWRRTEAGMKCEQADLSKQLEQAGVTDEEFLEEIYEEVDGSFLGVVLSDLLDA